MAEIKVYDIRLEYSRRPAKVIKSPEEAAAYFQKNIDKYKQDYFIAAYFNSKGGLLHFDVCTMNYAFTHKDMLLGNMILSNACSVITISNSDSPIYEVFISDYHLLAKLSGVLNHDHIILSEEKYYSYRENKIPIIKSQTPLKNELKTGKSKKNIFPISLVEKQYPLIDSRIEQEMTLKAAEELIINELSTADREKVMILSIDKDGKPLNAGYVSIGSVTAATFCGKDILKIPLLSGAASIELFHNHPSGDATPSMEDETSTLALINVANAVGIDVLDHKVVDPYSKTASSIKNEHTECFFNRLCREKEPTL